MIKTIIDFEILEQFFSKDKPDISDEINIVDRWITFKKFIKQECALEIVNYHKAINSIFINELTTGLGDSDFLIRQEFKEPYKCEIKETNPYTIFCLAEKLQEKKKKYEKVNGLLIAFHDDYLDKWSKISILKEPKNLPVRKNFEGKIFKSWNQLNSYLLPFTDIVIADNYLFADEVSIEYNLKPLLLLLDKRTTIRYNLSIITFEGNENLKSKIPKEKIDSEKIFNDIALFKNKNELKCELSFIVSDREIKEHDRGIFMNYLWVFSGSTFKYFNSTNDIITGTTIFFHPMSSIDNFNSASAALKNISCIVTNMRKKSPEKSVFGNFKNRLLDI